MSNLHPEKSRGKNLMHSSTLTLMLLITLQRQNTNDVFGRVFGRSMIQISRIT